METTRITKQADGTVEYAYLREGQEKPVAVLTETPAQRDQWRTELQRRLDQAQADLDEYAALQGVLDKATAGRAIDAAAIARVQAIRE